MNKKEYLIKLEKELIYLTKKELKKELDCYNKFFDTESSKNIKFEKTIESLGQPKDLAKNIYLKRGIDSSKLKRNIFNSIIDAFVNIINAFKNDKNNKKKMSIDIIYMFLIIILLKLPFNLVRDIGYNYIFIATSNETIETIWYLIFLLLYTITALCMFIVLARNFSKKYLID